jgi:membrane associated rhomboid family serine protease
MGIYDRDYYRKSPSRFGAFQTWSVTMWLIGINVAVFVLDGLMQRMAESPDAFGDPLVATSRRMLYEMGMGPLQRAGYFSFTLAVQHFQVWRFVTFQFLHESVGHLFWNMLGLYFFGPMVENHLGNRRYLAFYLLSGIGGAAGYIVLYACKFLLTDPAAPLIGASAGIFGVLAGAAKMAPGLPIRMWFPPVVLKLRTLVLIYIGIAFYTVVVYGSHGSNNAGGESAHLGGALVGFLLMSNEGLLDFFDRRWPRLRYGSRRVTFSDWRRDQNH